eukprot:CAMPEP_0197242226 /NCGR_PEP_ID=MMETSP1429-20130617/8041_1 /TAXON_ID=49237 /ORGANISM="Chaetoceros  sp., Strain UNC1202" /LENGTH=165 /DNA_ID=CAMNT_0042702213 /DNA_START=81 /DNA_END=579 /DNA_ORIENTATION=+
MMGDILVALDWYIACRTNQVTSTKNDKSLSSSASLEILSSKNFVYRWMRSLMDCGRFNLNIDFLDTKQKNCASSLLRYLLAGDLYHHCDATANSQSGQTFIYGEEHIQKLGQVYKIPGGGIHYRNVTNELAYTIGFDKPLSKEESSRESAEDLASSGNDLLQLNK